MSRAKGKRPKSRKTRMKAAGPVVWTIIVIDQEPLRRKTASECQREMRRLEKARGDWRRFEQEDKPAFERWMAVTFGVLMSEMREINGQIHEKEMLIEEVEAEMFIGNWPSYEAAYRAVRRRREQPPAVGGAPGGDGGFAGGADARDEAPPEEPDGLSELEEELLFEEFVRTFMGMNPDRMSEKMYAKMLADFRANVLGKGPREEPKAQRNTLPGRKTPPRTEKTPRIKELYRILVRRLHPDTKADTDAQVSAIWHEVQQAYSDGNVERLEMLLALTDIQAESAGAHTSVSQMRAVLTELRRSLHALLRSLGAAKREMAWNFVENKNRGMIEQRLRRQMERDVSMRKRQLEEIDAFIASWSAPKRKRHGKRQPRHQAEFPF